MKQHPDYLRNQSRYAHRLYRRQRRFLRYFTWAWLIVFCSLAAVATLDVLVDVGWGYTMGDVWTFVAFAAGGCFIWLFSRAVLSLVLGISRRVYGPEPAEPLADETA
jgi:hypothetical protein